MENQIFYLCLWLIIFLLTFFTKQRWWLLVACFVWMIVMPHFISVRGWTIPLSFFFFAVLFLYRLQIGGRLFTLVFACFYGCVIFIVLALFKYAHAFFFVLDPAILDGVCFYLLIFFVAKSAVDQMLAMMIGGAVATIFLNQLLIWNASSFEVLYFMLMNRLAVGCLLAFLLNLVLGDLPIKRSQIVGG